MEVRLDKGKLERLIRATSTRADAFLRAAAEEMTNEIVLSFGTSPPGQQYRRGGITHTASQPGYPPNVDVGTLRASMRWRSAGRLRCYITDGVEYGIHLEQGTERMAARPFVAPVFEVWRRGRLVGFARQWGLLSGL